MLGRRRTNSSEEERPTLSLCACSEKQHGRVDRPCCFSEQADSICGACDLPPG